MEKNDATDGWTDNPPLEKYFEKSHKREGKKMLQNGKWEIINNDLLLQYNNYSPSISALCEYNHSPLTSSRERRVLINFGYWIQSRNELITCVFKLNYCSPYTTPTADDAILRLACKEISKEEAFVDN